MSNTKIISSLQNPLIKNISLLLEKARERRKQNKFVAEGLIEVSMALKANYEIDFLLYDPSVTSENIIHPLLDLQAGLSEKRIEVSTAVMEKIAYRAGVSNVVGVFSIPNRSLEDIVLPSCPLILILETVEKPGNLGAILRTADAAGVNAVILCDPQTDWYNPNVIRASLGAIFNLPIFDVTATETLQWIHQQAITIFANHLEASQLYYDCDMTKATALVMGTESDGISDFWIQAAHQRIIIPMFGKVDSMNVSVSTAILLFEAIRQRSKGFL